MTKPKNTSPSITASASAAKEVGSNESVCPTNFVMRSSSSSLESKGKQVVAVIFWVDGTVYAKTRQYLELPL